MSSTYNYDARNHEYKSLPLHLLNSLALSIGHVLDVKSEFVLSFQIPVFIVEHAGIMT